MNHATDSQVTLSKVLIIMSRTLYVVLWGLVTVLVEFLLLTFLFWLSVMQRLGFLQGVDITFSISVVLALNIFGVVVFAWRWVTIYHASRALIYANEVKPAVTTLPTESEE